MPRGFAVEARVTLEKFYPEDGRLLPAVGAP